MRIWSIHPSYLDAKGLVALWRETLLAKKVLESKTRGYRNHSQLVRFKRLPEPLNAVNCYLSHVYSEALNRGYNFNEEKINWKFTNQTLDVTHKQIQYEFSHLKKKLLVRDYNLYLKINALKIIKPHPVFQIIDGEIEDWEVIN